MKTITFIRSFIVASMFLLMQPSQVFSASFTKGNLVVARVANGTAGFQNVLLDEYTTAGAFVQTVALPTTTSGNNRPIGIDCQSAIDGTLNLSVDKRYLLMGGYKTGVASVLPSAGNNRIIATVSNDATINTTTELSDNSANAWAFRSVVSTNGTDLWLSGQLGINYTTRGASSSTNVAAAALGPTNQGIYDSKLYFSSYGNTNYFGSLNNGLPSTGSQPYTVLAALPTPDIGIIYPMSFVMFDMDASIPGVDVMYVAENSKLTGAGGANSARGLMKYCLNSSGLWVKKGAIIRAPIDANGLKGLTGVCNAATGAITLYATTVSTTVTDQTSIVTLTDNTGYNGLLSGSFTSLVTSSTGTAFRGIVFAPEAAATSTVPDAPVSVAATAGSAVVSVAFSTPNNTGGSAITGYTVTPYLAGVAQTPVSGTSSPIAVSGLTNGTAYTFKVFATNSIGNSAESVATASVTPNIVSFTKGNLVVARVANATAGWQSVYLDEYSTTGRIVQSSIMLPNATSGNNRPIGIDCQSAQDGTLNLSGDKRFLLMGGYKTGLASVLSTQGNTRIVATVDKDATINTTTELTDIGTANWGFKSVVSTNGTNMWLSGLFGLNYTTLGASTSTNLTTLNGVNQGIYDNKLYLASTTTSNLFTSLNNGLPTSGGSQPYTVLAATVGNPTIGIVYPMSFVMFDMNASIPGVDVMYVAEYPAAGNASKGLTKYCLDGTGLWVKKGTTIAPTGATYGLKGLTGVYNASTGITLYATTVSSTGSDQTSIVTLTDNSGYNGLLAGSFTSLVTSGSGTAFRGIAFTPQVVTTVPDAPVSVVATAGNTQASVAFSTPNNNGGSVITGYTVTPYNGATAGTPVSGTVSPILVTGLTNGTSYTFKVYATNSVGNSAVTTSAAVTPIATPVPFAPIIGAAAVSGVTGTATVAFTAPADNGGAAITSYTATSSPGGITGTLTQAGCGTITVTGLTIGTTYTFTVKANNTAGASAASGSSNSVTLTATITGTAIATAFNTTYGTASAPQSFSVSGANLTADLVATAPTGFEVSSDGTSYASTATFTQLGGSASGTLRIRMSATAAVTGTYNSKNIVLSTTGATSVNITTAASGNAVSKATPSISVSGTQTFTYNGSAQGPATVSYSGDGTPSLLYTSTDTHGYSSATAPTNAGTYQVVYSATAGANYNAASTSAYPFTIYSTGVVTAANTKASDLTLSSSSDISITGSGTLEIDVNNTSVHSVTAAPGTQLTIDLDKSLSVSANLELQSNSSGTATLVDQTTNGGLTVNGTTTVKQYLGGARNWYISAPVTGSHVPASGYTFYSRNEPAANWTTMNSDSILKVGRGYIANLTTGTDTYNFVGTLYTGDKSVGLGKTIGVDKSGFNLLGNPYSSHYTLTKSVTDAANALNTIWYRTATWVEDADPLKSKYVYLFQTCLLKPDGSITGTPGTTTNIIAPMQSFWVRTSTDGSTFTFANTQRSHQSSNFLKAPAKKNSNEQFIRLQVSRGVITDETVIYSNVNAGNGFESYDALKMNNNSTLIPEIYTLADGQQMAINGMNSIPYETEMPLGFTTLTSGYFSIRASQIANFQTGTQVILKDYADVNNPVITDLSDGSSYSFTSAIAQNNTSRFSLTFKAPSVATGINSESNSNEWISTNANNEIFINGSLNGETSVVVYNALGQRIMSKNLSKANVQLGSSIASGVYMITLTSGVKKLTRKVIID